MLNYEPATLEISTLNFGYTNDIFLWPDWSNNHKFCDWNHIKLTHIFLYTNLLLYYEKKKKKIKYIWFSLFLYFVYSKKLNTLVFICRPQFWKYWDHIIVSPRLQLCVFLSHLQDPQNNFYGTSPNMYRATKYEFTYTITKSNKQSKQ